MCAWRVLICDDDELFVRWVRRVVSAWGYDVLVAYDGSQGLALLTKERMDVVLADINMPCLSGIELVRGARGLGLSVPVVFMTGGPSLESTRESANLGVLRYLIKPLDCAELRKALREALGESPS
jgi:DNA-binding response OmpR family regulator